MVESKKKKKGAANLEELDDFLYSEEGVDMSLYESISYTI